MTLNKRLVISSVLLTLTVVTIFTLNKSAEAVEVCDNTGQNTVSAQTDPKNGESQITNSSDSCAYKVGVASFRQTADSKELYDVKYGVVKKNETLAINIEVPENKYQYETFVGDLYNRQNITTKDSDTPRSDIPTPTDSPLASTITQAPTSVPTVTVHPTATPTDEPAATATPTLTAENTPIPTPVVQIVNNNNNTNNNTNEQRIIIEDNGRGSSGDVLSVTDRGRPVYAPPQKISSTPNTGPEMLSLLALIPTGIAGLLLRRKI